MSRGLKSLLPYSFSKRLNNNDSSLNKGLATFALANRQKFVSQERELSSLSVTPDRPFVDEQFQLKVGLFFHTADSQHISSNAILFLIKPLKPP